MPTMIFRPTRSLVSRSSNPCAQHNPCGCGCGGPVAPPPTTGFGIPATFDVKSLALGAVIGALLVYAILKFR